MASDSEQELHGRRRLMDSRTSLVNRNFKDNSPTGWSIAGLALLWAALSCCLTNFNGYLLTEGNFPFPVPLVMYHAFLTSLAMLVLYGLKPALFVTLCNA